jgi:RimJ/RimL family protein N-acetyltransferase
VRLETERLVLRKPEAADFDAYLEMRSDPEVVRYLGGEVAGRKETAAGIERMLRHWERHGIGLFTVVRKEDERIVGRTGFLLWDPEAWVNALREELEGPLETEVGWTFARAFWNRGYATEAAIACRDLALGELGKDRLISLIAEGNIASMRVAEKIGERLEREDIGGPFARRVDLYSIERHHS